MNKAYLIRVDLDGASPAIWRKILIEGNASLFELHLSIQLAMGWENAHLYQFDFAGKLFGNIEWNDEGDVNDDRASQVQEVLDDRKVSEFYYTYDFGDNWEHTLTVEKVLDYEEDKQYPVCISGARACPPEDCGGIYAYHEILETLKKKRTKAYKELIEWLGDDFDPNVFDILEANRNLKLLDSFASDEEGMSVSDN